MKLDYETCKEHQDHHVEAAKNILRRDRHLYPLAFVATTDEGLRAWKDRPKVLALAKLDEHGAKKIDPQKSKLAPIGEVMISMAPNWKTLFGYAQALWPERAAALEMARRLGLGPPFNLCIADTYERSMRAFMRAINCEEKDLTTALVRMIAEKTKASAVINLSEAWTVTLPDNDSPRPKDFSTAEGSREILMCALSMRDRTRLVCTPFYRKPSKPGEPRDAGEVEGFGDPEISEGPREQFEGRMIDFFRGAGLDS